jgi:pyridinium-3,5-biscarboxylic acid mononucleotide sulfurtransferase
MLLSPPRTGLQEKIDKVVQIISQFNGVVVALSAGVDSSLVAVLAGKALGERAIAATALSESLAPGEMEIAKKTAKQIGIQHFVVTTDEVHNASYTANPSNRCYYCKDTLYRELRREADKLGFEAILDGTQIDDLGEVRPGLLAAKEAGVRSPLAEAGFSKKDVRETARFFGLDVWDKPAMPCLSSRIPHGEEITVQKLSQVGEAESIVKRLSGARDIRVRHHGTVASIEVSQEELPQFRQAGLMTQVEKELEKLGFTEIIVGPRKHSTKQLVVDPRQDRILPILNTSNH